MTTAIISLRLYYIARFGLVPKACMYPRHGY